MNTYYCQACGASVGAGENSCPDCGRSFLGVQCPRCGSTGPAKNYIEACPDCAYRTETSSRDLESLINESADFLSVASTTNKSLERESQTINQKRKARLPTVLYWILSSLIIILLSAAFLLWLNS